jgi:hypothetical protein
LGGLACLGLVSLSNATAAEQDMLCVGSHPAPRRPNVTYGGLLPRDAYIRDHRVPLCIGGDDTPTNVWYQPRDEAKDKDRLERYACESYCSGAISLTNAKNLFINLETSYLQIFGETPPHGKDH